MTQVRLTFESDTPDDQGGILAYVVTVNLPEYAETMHLKGLEIMQKAEQIKEYDDWPEPDEVDL